MSEEAVDLIVAGIVLALALHAWRRRNVFTLEDVVFLENEEGTENGA